MSALLLSALLLSALLLSALLVSALLVPALPLLSLTIQLTALFVRHKDCCDQTSLTDLSTLSKARSKGVAKDYICFVSSPFGESKHLVQHSLVLSLDHFSVRRSDPYTIPALGVMPLQVEHCAADCEAPEWTAHAA